MGRWFFDMKWAAGSRRRHCKHRSPRGLYPYRFARNSPSPSRWCITSQESESVNRSPHPRYWCTYGFLRSLKWILIATIDDYRLVNPPSAMSSPSLNVSPMSSSTLQRVLRDSYAIKVRTDLSSRVSYQCIFCVAQKKDELERVAKSNRWKASVSLRIGKRKPRSMVTLGLLDFFLVTHQTPCHSMFVMRHHSCSKLPHAELEKIWKHLTRWQLLSDDHCWYIMILSTSLASNYHIAVNKPLLEQHGQRLYYLLFMSSWATPTQN